MTKARPAGGVTTTTISIEVTDVAQRFPQRARKDGRFYAIDFTLDEIKSLKFTEGFEPKNGKNVQTYPGRFPMGKSDFRIHTFEEGDWSLSRG